MEGKHLAGVHDQADHGKRPGQEKAKEPGHPQTDLAVARVKGAQAARSGLPPTSPYGASTPLDRAKVRAWHRGYRDGPG